MFGGEFLADLNAAAVAVHVAEAANIHQDVEAELLSGAEGPQHFVVAAAMAQSQVDDLAANDFARGFDRQANLAIGIVAVLVNQRSRQFDLEQLFFQKIDGRSRRRLASRPSTRTQSASSCAGSRFRTGWDRHISPGSGPPGLPAAIPARRARPAQARRRESARPVPSATPGSRCTRERSPHASATLPIAGFPCEYARADATPGFPACAR